MSHVILPNGKTVGPPAPGWQYDALYNQWASQRGDVFDADNQARYDEVRNEYWSGPFAKEEEEGPGPLSTSWFPIESAPFDTSIEVCGRSSHDTSALFATVAKKAALWPDGHNWSTSDGHPFDGLGWEPLFWRIATEFPLRLFHLHQHGTNEGQL